MNVAGMVNQDHRRPLVCPYKHTERHREWTHSSNTGSWIQVQVITWHRTDHGSRTIGALARVSRSQELEGCSSMLSGSEGSQLTMSMETPRWSYVMFSTCQG